VAGGAAGALYCPSYPPSGLGRAAFVSISQTIGDVRHSRHEGIVNLKIALMSFFQVGSFQLLNA
jgi:hypothetical protein